MIASLSYFGDRINPIVVKEVRQAVNSRLVGGALLLFLLVQMVVMTGNLVLKDPSYGADTINLRAGREVFAIVQGILVGACILIIPAFTGVRLAAERSDVNVDLLFITSLSPWKIISGKFVAAAALALLIFSACAPFMTFAYVLRGLDLPTILLVLLTDFLAVLLGTIFTIFLASIPASRGFRIILALAGIIGLGYLMAGAIGASVLLLRFEIDLDFASMEFWLGLAGSTLLVLGAIGIFFVWSIALVSPVSANRALPVRIYSLGLWLAAGVGCAIFSEYIHESEPIAAWAVGGAIMFSLQLLIGVSEREELGPRVARRIPQRMLHRVPAFLFFSGAAGGIAFGVLGGAVSLAVGGVCHSLYPHGRLHSDRVEEGMLMLGALVLAYTYCYCLTAVVVRKLLKNKGLQTFHTWLIALILFGLGSSLPFLFGEMVSDGYSRSYKETELFPLFLPSPVVTIEESTGSSHQFTYLTIVFLVVWGIAVTMANMSWFVGQVRRFRPPARPKDKAPAPIEVASA